MKIVGKDTEAQDKERKIGEKIKFFEVTKENHNLEQ